jgi:hypothetical protein
MFHLLSEKVAIAKFRERIGPLLQMLFFDTSEEYQCQTTDDSMKGIFMNGVFINGPQSRTNWQNPTEGSTKLGCNIIIEKIRKVFNPDPE